MKFLLMGHSVVDFIHEKELVKNQPGGLFYSAAALQNWKAEEDDVSLATLISDECYHFFADVYEKLDRTFIQIVQDVPTIHLTIHANKERDERYENLSTQIKIPFDRLKVFDGILINMITGFEITLSDLQIIRNKFNGIIYFDVHSLARGIDENMQRNFRSIDNFYEWAKCIDILQANENEFLTLSEKSNSSFTIAKELLSYGIKIILLTKGKSGVRAFFKQKNEVESIFIPSIKINTINNVGCGDVFGAVFFYDYLASKNLIYSVKRANCAGGKVTSYPSTSYLKNLKTDVNRELFK